MAYPYLQLIKAYPNGARTLGEISVYSVGFKQFFIAPARNWLWGPGSAAARESVQHHGGWEVHSLPGYFLAGLAILGLALSAWSLRYRLALALGIGVCTWLAMGVAAPWSRPYQALFWNLPGWNAIRTPGRLVLWDILLLALLAAGLVTALSERAQAWLRRRPPGPARRVLRPALAVALLVPAGLIVLEGVPDTPFPEVPSAPVSFASLAEPTLVLPTDLAEDELIQLWSVDGFPDIANGSSGYIPPGLFELRKTVESFPDAASVAYLRGRGIRTVVVERHPHFVSWPENAPALTNPVDGLGITREDQPEVILYHLQPR
jgi:hypothetical protein